MKKVRPQGRRSGAISRSVELLENRLLLAAHIVGNSAVFSTIQAAVNAAAPGAVINVDPGVYSELVNVNKPLTLRGAKAGVDARSNFRLGLAGESLVLGTPVSDGNSSAFYIAANDVTVDGFNCQNNTSINQYGAGIVIAPGVSGTHILNNVLKNNISGLFLANSSSTDPAVIQYNAFRSNNNNGSLGGRGIYSDSNIAGGALTNVIIDSNFFIANHGDWRTTTALEAAISFESYYSQPQSNIRITNNTFEENGKSLLAWNATNLLIQGNVASDTLDSGSGTFRFEGGDSNVTLTGNNIYDNLAPAVHIDTKAFGATNSGFAINNNNLYGNGYDFGIGSLVIGAGTYDGGMDASNNWWGDASGPGGDFSGLGDAATVNGTAVTVSPWAASPAMAQESAFAGPSSVPGPLIQAENFDQGGPGIAYNIAGALNKRGTYRATPAQIESTSDSGGGVDVSSLQAGQWLAYTLNVPQAGIYRVDVRAANAQPDPSTFNLALDNTDVTGPITLLSTGGVQTWATVSSPSFAVTPGTHVLRLVMDSNASGGFSGSFNWLNLVYLAAVPTPPSAPTGLTATAVSSSQINLSWTNTASNQSGFEIDRSIDGVNFTPWASVAGTVTQWSDTGLSASTQYWYRVEATNLAGVSGSSNVANATTSPAVPTAPTGLSATTVSSSQINLAWTNTSIIQTGVELDRSTDGVTFVPLTTVDAAVDSYSDMGLATGTSYYYRVEATNGSVLSPSSNIASAATLPSIPTAPTGLTATTVSASQINLSWTNTASNQTSVEIDRSGDGVTFAPLTTVGASVSTYSDGALAASTTYYYRVEAVNAAGPSSGSNIANATTQAAPTLVTTYLSDLTWASATSGWGTVHKDASVEGNPIRIRGTTYAKGIGTHAISNIVYNLAGQYQSFLSDVGIDDETAGQGFVRFQVMGDGKLLFDSGVVNGTSPVVHVNVSVANVQQLTLVVLNGISANWNWDHSDWANARLMGAPVVPSAPTAPANLTAAAVSSSQIRLDWSNTANNQTAIEVDRSSDGVNFSFLANLGATATTYTDFNLAPSTKYFYRVLATNSVGPSPSSNIVSATTPAMVVTTYLSDLTWASATSGWGTVHKDASVGGNPIRIRGTTYAKGIGTHAISNIVYNLAGQYQSFLSDVGIDDETAGQGFVRFQVMGDGKLLFDSGVVNGKSPVVHVNVSVANVQQLTLVVLNGITANWNWDHSDWANARLLS